MNKDTNVKETTACSIGDFGNLSTWGKQGWICPKCGNVMGPYTSYCIFCAKGNSNTVAQTTPNLSDPKDWNSTGYHPREDKITICN